MESNEETEASVITVESLREIFLPKILEAKGDKNKLWEVIKEHAEFLAQNYSRLTSEAKKVADGLVESITEQVEKAVPSLPDTIQTRQFKRSLRACKGERLIAKTHLVIFDLPPQTVPMYQKAKEIFENQLQTLMDFYQDVSDESFRGQAKYSQLGLFGVCMDELMAAFSLAQRSFPGQAMQHLRTTQEALDLIRLFREQPQWADLWTSQKPWQEIWKELSPGKVREKIKSSSAYREIYGRFSSFGTHPSFEMIRLRSRRKPVQSETKNIQIEIRVGGMPDTKENLTAHVLLLLLTASISAELAASFGERLHIEEIKSELLGSVEAFGNFALEFIVKPLEKSGKPEAKEFEDFLKSHLEKVKRGFDAMLEKGKG